MYLDSIIWILIWNVNCGYFQEDLEQSISQLVVDDDEMDDPAIMTITKRQPIPQVGISV